MYLFPCFSKLKEFEERYRSFPLCSLLRRVGKKKSVIIEVFQTQIFYKARFVKEGGKKKQGARVEIRKGLSFFGSDRKKASSARKRLMEAVQQAASIMLQWFKKVAPKMIEPKRAPR